MSPSLSELLKLPAGERAELAMTLWESLTEAEREGELELTPDEAAEPDGAGWTTFSGLSPQSLGMKSAASCWIESEPPRQPQA
jgi:hypothetical protein